MSFDNFGLDASLLAGIAEMGFTQPTKIQTAAIPAGLEGKDLLASAMTGSGKTAAFLLPVMQRLLGKPRGKTRALVLSPTRELAAQTHEHFVALARRTPLTGAAIFGGVGMGPQEQALRRGVDLIAATPGRLLDHLRNPYAKLDDIEVLVLDEADRMLDMGFLPDIRRILKTLPAQRQTLFFSATMPAPIVELSRQMLSNPVRVEIERKTAPATGVTQALYPVSDNLKAALFLELLQRGEVGSAIVFCRTKHRSNRLAETLERAGIPNARIHGNRSQSARTDALDGFKKGRYRILVATDIVARGIDVEALEHVVNFDVPNQPEDYVHRVGRTGRAEATGDAITLVSPDEERSISLIERAISQKLPRLKLEGFDYNAKPTERFEVPIGERIAEIRRRKAEDRERARLKAERKAQAQGREGQAPRRDGGRGNSSYSRDSGSSSRDNGSAAGGRSTCGEQAGPSRGGRGAPGGESRRGPGEGGAGPSRSERGGAGDGKRRAPAHAGGRNASPRDGSRNGRGDGGRNRPR